MNSLTVRSVLTFAALDVLFNPLVTAAYIQLLGYRNPSGPYFVMAAMCALKIAASAWFLSTQLRPADRYFQDRGGRTNAEQLKQVDSILQQLPRRFGLFYAFSWSGTYGLGFAAISTAYPELTLDPRAVAAVCLVVTAVWFGGFAFAFPISSILTADAAGGCSIDARENGIHLSRPRTSLQVRTGTIALALGLGPTLWMMALGYMKQVEAHIAHAEVRATLATKASELRWNQNGTLDERSLSAGMKQEVVSTTEGSRVPSWLSGDAYEWLRETFEGHEGTFQEPHEQRAVAFTSLDNDRAIVTVVDTAVDSPQSFILSASIFAVVVGLWAPLCAIALGRSVSGPLQRLTASAREIVEEGKQSQMGTLPVPRSDEVGMLSERFNDLLDMMRDLSAAADAIASGNLRVTIERNGELPDAFRRMLESLQNMVSQIRETSVNLASAATEIFAASQEQEAAATSQSSAMEEISRTMDSLSESAAHVSDAVQGVLANAEKTLENTDDMVSRIGQLSAHAGRIAEILDIIKEIAERSDLLALNGSLEASRAGEGGQGFALVAGEMRRLAERVTASVSDIKTLVADIRDSGSTTVMATEESRRLAEGTTEAARQITFVSQQQRSGTEQVSQSVKNIADVVTQAVSATSQTRTSAEGLKTQADELAKLVKRFDLAASAEVG